MIHDQLTLEALEAFPDLEQVITRSAGYDHLPLDRLRERGAGAYHLGDYASTSVAHVATGMIVSLLHRFPEANAATRNGVWDRSGLVGRSLQEVTVGLVGVGRIGQATAEVLGAFGCPRLLGHDPARPAWQAPDSFSWVTSLEELLGQIDVVSLHAPLTAGTRHLLDADAIARMKPGSLLVNTARGAIVDQEAVAAALDGGHLAGYAADVLPGEPTPTDLVRFQDHPNVLLTPHLGAHNTATQARRYETLARILEAIRRRDTAFLAPYAAI